MVSISCSTIKFLTIPPPAHPLLFSRETARHGWSSSVTKSQFDVIEKWWPDAPSPQVAAKLRRGVIRGGDLFPINITICAALLSEIYATDSSKAGAQVIPIAGFGIVAGDTKAKPQDRLAHCDSATRNITVDQDPRQHSRIYFTIIRGEGTFLDCGMFHFNSCTRVSTEGCCLRDISELFPTVPALFYDGEMPNGVPGMPWKERMRCSVLRNENLHKTIQHTAAGPG